MARGTRSVARSFAVALIVLPSLAPAAFAAAPTSAPRTTVTPPPTTAASPSATGAAGPAHVTAAGTAVGELALGSTLPVRVSAQDSLGWQHLGTIEVSLRLNDQPLDTIVIDPTAYSISIVDSGAPVSIGQTGTLEGPYFRLDNGKASVSANTQAKRFSLTFPLHLIDDPPPKALLVLVATDSSGVSSNVVNLSEPVQTKDQGFPWGTIGLAVAAALFIGGFVGNTFSTRRAKARPNVYATVAKRLQDDKAKR